MTAILDWIDPATLACLALAALLLALGSGKFRHALRPAGSALLLVASLALLASLTVPWLLPLRSAVPRGDGSTDDPRVLTSFVAAIVALAALLPSWRALGLSAITGAGTALPGIALGALLGSLAYFAGLRAPMGLATVALGSFAMGTALVLAVRRTKHSGGLGLPLQAFGVGALVVAGVLSLHGARATGVTLSEGASADTLGMRLSLAGVESPRPNAREMSVSVYSGRDSLRFRPRFEGQEGVQWRPVADGSVFSGPVVVPMTLRTQRARAHEILWVAKQDSLKAGGATIRFTGFRIEHKDSIRMFADLEVTTPGGTQKVSPGVIATSKGEQPFPATARGFGPIVVAQFDPDNHRVGLVLPVAPTASGGHLLVLDVRLRPALPFAWAGAALALVGFLFALAAAGAPRRAA